MTHTTARTCTFVALVTLAALDACSSDSGPPSAPEPTFSVQTGGNTTLVVDNDRADCPQAHFNSIQAAVDAAQPGDKILVCRGVYPENVLVEKAGLRIEAHAAPGEVVLQGPGLTELGFHVLNTTGVLLQGFTVRQFRTGILIQRGGTNVLRKNVTTANQRGIEVFNSADNVVEQNTSFLNTELRVPGGVFVAGSGSTRNIIRHNEASQNDSGIGTIGAGPDNILFGNRSYANMRYGILNAVGSHRTVIENNHVFGNAQGGIHIGASNDVSARNNRSEENTGFGIRLANRAANNLVEKNQLFENTEDGVLLETNVTANIVQLNHIRQNGRDGIRADATSGGNTIERNVMLESGEHDAHDDSVGAGSGGTANIWLGNHCQTMNRPGLCRHSVGTSP